MDIPGLDKLKKMIHGSRSSGKKEDALPKPSSPGTIPAADNENPDNPVAVKVPKPTTRPPSLIDQVSSLFHEDKGKGTKSKTVPKTSSPVTIPTTGNDNPDNPVAVKVPKPTTRQPSLIDQVSSLFHGTKGKEAKSKTVP